MRPVAPAAVLAVLLSAVAANAQPAKSTTAPAKKGANTLEVAGYRTMKIEGFTVLVSEDAFNSEAAKFKRPPMDVLELELKTIGTIMTARSVDLLRKLIVWVEWDETKVMSNGRAGRALAVYYGGHQASLLANGKHPLKAKTVTVLSLKSLTEEHQPGEDSGRCVLLHEFAHAYHDQLLGMDNPRVKAAYKAAMERKLYDKSHYASTNPSEFFAEMTCCYLNKLDYFPQTRDDLKKHDPATFKLMESIWKASAKPQTAAGKSPGNGEGEFNLGITFPKDVRFGPLVSGPAPRPDLTAGKVVLLGYWGGANNANVLNKLNAIHDELAPYGLAVIAPNPYVTDPDDVKTEAVNRGARYTVVQSGFLREGDTPVNPDAPHAVLFDVDGKCLFRGSAFKADTFAKTAVSRVLLAKLGDDDDLGPAFAPLLKAVDAGAGPLDIIPRAKLLAADKDGDVAGKGKQLLDLLYAPGTDGLAAAKGKSTADPYEAYQSAERLAGTYKNTPIAVKANEMMTGLRGTKAVAAELRARPTFDKFKKLTTTLAAQPGGFDPKSPRFRQQNAAALGQVKATLDTLRKQNANTATLKEAETIAKDFGVE